MQATETEVPTEPKLDQTLETVTGQAQEALSRLLSGDVRGIVELAAGFLIPASLALLAIFIGYLFARYLSRVISQPICRRVDETLGKFVGRIVFYSILLGVIGGTLSQVGFKMGGLAALLAAAGFAIGLAFQGTLSNFAAGVLLLVFRPFKVGDMINAGGVMGRVNEIDLFTTTLDTPDNRRIIVPNSSISGGIIENISYHSCRRIEVAVGVDYGADLHATRQALQAAVDRLADNIIPGEQRGSAVILSTLGPSSVDWKVRAWVKTVDFFAMSERLTSEIKTQLDLAEVRIPFPQMDVHLYRTDEAEAINIKTAKGVNTTTGRKRPMLREHEASIAIATSESA